MKNHKATELAHLMFDHHQPASVTPFKWRFAGRPMMAHLYWYLDPISPNQLKKTKTKIGPPLTQLSGSFHFIDPENTCTKKNNSKKCSTFITGEMLD